MALAVDGAIVVTVDKVDELFFAHATYKACWMPADSATVVTTSTLIIDKLRGEYSEFPNVYLTITVVTCLWEIAATL